MAKKKTKVKPKKKARTRISLKANFKDSRTLRKEYVQEKYGWNERACDMLKSDIALMGIMLIGFVSLIYYGNFSWNGNFFGKSNLLALGVIGFVFLEIIYYFSAIRGQKKKATYSETFGHKIMSTLAPVVLIATYQIVLILVPIFTFVYGNHLWTNYMRKKQYEEEL